MDNELRYNVPDAEVSGADLPDDTNDYISLSTQSGENLVHVPVVPGRGPVNIQKHVRKHLGF